MINNVQRPASPVVVGRRRSSSSSGFHLPARADSLAAADGGSPGFLAPFPRSQAGGSNHGPSSAPVLAPTPRSRPENPASPAGGGKGVGLVSGGLLPTPVGGWNAQPAGAMMRGGAEDGGGGQRIRAGAGGASREAALDMLKKLLKVRGGLHYEGRYG